MNGFVMPYLSEGLTAMIAGFAGWFFTRRKTRAEGRKSELETVQEAIKIWRETAGDLKDEVRQLREENKTLRSEVTKLRISNNRILKALDKLNVENFDTVIKDLHEKISEHE